MPSPDRPPNMNDILPVLHSERFGEPVLDVERLKGDGSARTIHRITGMAHTSIGVSGTSAAENRAFLSFTRTFASRGLRVPAILAVSRDELDYLLEDLGETTLLDWITERRPPEGWSGELTGMYRRVLRELPLFQIAAGREIDFTLCCQHAEFGEASMLFDLHYFREMFLKPLSRRAIDGDALEKDFASLIARLLRAERRYFLYRDFQSRNIMIREGEPWFIDYQSGRRGALAYDVASLLNDARAEVPPEVREELIDCYLEEASRHAPIDAADFRRGYDGFALIRILQALGAFGNLGIRQGKRFFLESIPYGIRNLRLFLDRTDCLASLPCLSLHLRSLAEDESLISMRFAAREEHAC